MNSNDIYRAVQERYTAVVSKEPVNDKYAPAVAESFGYSRAELESIPKDANLGLSCGNPLVIAGLREGEVVVDLGCGAGFDVFLASRKVGSKGRAIGVDMNGEMLAKANRNKDLMGAKNVEFVKAPITDISSLPDDSADCIISNCVVNLVPESEKQLAFNEMARLLRPGGRVAISDILLKKELPPGLEEDLALYVGCIAGASRVEDYNRYLRAAGFKEILISDTQKDLNVYKDLLEGDEGASCCGTSDAGLRGSQARDENAAAGLQSVEIDYNVYAGAFKIFAVMGAVGDTEPGV